jgi:hypothetical protein
MLNYNNNKENKMREIDLDILESAKRVMPYCLRPKVKGEKGFYLVLNRDYAVLGEVFVAPTVGDLIRRITTTPHLEDLYLYNNENKPFGKSKKYTKIYLKLLEQIYNIKI